MVYEIKRLNLSSLSWRKIGLALVLVLLTFLVAFLGYLTIWAWQRYLAPLSGVPDRFDGWQVYRSEVYPADGGTSDALSGAFSLGLRYPKDWEAKEVKASFVTFIPSGPRDYVTLTTQPTSERPKSECEKDKTECSFYTHGIYGEKTITPETETVFFSHEGNDFTLTLFKYGDADFSPIFEEMSKSLRFITEKTE